MKVKLNREGIRFPRKCLECGAQAETEMELVRKMGFIFGGTGVFDVLNLNVPACRKCKVTHLIGEVFWLISTGSIFLWGAFQLFDYLEDSLQMWLLLVMLLVFTYWLAAGAMRSYDVLFRRVSISRFDSNPETVVLTFRKDDLAREVAELQTQKNGTDGTHPFSS